MNKRIIGVLITTSVLCISCHKSIADDARKAANLDEESVWFAQKGDLTKSEERFKDSEQIKSKYKKSAIEFDKLFVGDIEQNKK